MDTGMIVAETDALRARFMINSVGHNAMGSIFSPGTVPSPSERIVLAEACKTLPAEQGDKALAFLKTLEV